VEPPPYVYRCVDRSLLVDGFRRRWVVLFSRWLPEWLPANLVTLGASACMWAVLAVAAGAGSLAPSAVAVAFVVLMQVHLVYDHADGMHAKRTATGSALGEYLDHSLDAYHGAITVLTFFALVGFGNVLLALVMVWSWHLAFAATMVDQRERGELYLGPIGSLEGGLLFTGFYLSWLAPPARAWWLAPLVAGVPAYALAVAAGAAGTLTTALLSVRRMGRLPAPLALFAAAGLVLTLALAAGPLPFWGAVAALLLYCGDYTGRVLGSHLLGGRRPWPDPVAPPLAIVAAALPHRPAWVPAALLLYLALRTAAGVVLVLRPLRHHWRWINRTPAPDAVGR
jgi:phosphatidylglycerophosphate synthase